MNIQHTAAWIFNTLQHEYSTHSAPWIFNTLQILSFYAIDLQVRYKLRNNNSNNSMNIKYRIAWIFNILAWQIIDQNKGPIVWQKNCTNDLPDYVAKTITSRL